VRSLKNPRHFYMSRNRAPGLVAQGDIMEFDENSAPVDQEGRQLYNERFIHGEVFRARPDVQAVVHSHAPEVLPFSVTDTPLKALIHVANFLGSEPVPVFDLEDVEGPRKLGDRNVVLLRGHGMTVVGASVRRAVYNAIYAQINAKVELEALRLGKPKFLNQFEAQRVGQINRAWELWADHAKVAP
jgi:ribulose-5-phosphate 4-epimerase/fuculose-1-phosphate aldolase